MPSNFSSEQYKQLNKQVTPPAATFERLQQKTPSSKAAPVLNNLPTTPSKATQSKTVNSLLTGIKNLPLEAAQFKKKKGAGLVALALGSLIVGSYSYTIKSMKQENFADVVIPDTLKLKE
ncbi:predicted protein [Naegleria gruberi]|uniref:Predicted protein n=1 Tax=Naegleria gruberi TaxID=5762 RepID=D2VBI3_NAEGR|nr:uncharacterized protein NAEGRDRAFT_66227 [Naegleria gruberi]EFC45803.1 predicted protein [Naegleria gruberi]|eukprot:XP_002678547.1 predicted protein [Naegleria gruberi strain NEG-M]